MKPTAARQLHAVPNAVDHQVDANDTTTFNGLASTSVSCRGSSSELSKAEQYLDKLLTSVSEQSLLLVKDGEHTTAAMRCGACGNQVAELGRAETRLLLAAEPGRKEDVRAFECKQCQVVIFEDELLDSRFVPSWRIPSSAEEFATNLLKRRSYLQQIQRSQK